MKTTPIFILIQLCITIAVGTGCGKGNTLHPNPPKPNPPTPPIEMEKKLSNILDLISAENVTLLKDSLWKDSVNHTLYLEIGPIHAPSALAELQLSPGTILNQKELIQKGLYTEAMDVEKLPVIISTPQGPFRKGYSYTPSYTSFNHFLQEYVLQENPTFESLHFGNGVPFSTYGDLVLIHGFKNTPIETWLTIHHKQPSKKTTGVVFMGTITDFTITTNLPGKDNLLNRDLYKNKIDADALCYINTMRIGKKAVLTVMADTTADAIRGMVTKIRKSEILSPGELKLLLNGEVGYSLYGFSNTLSSTIDNPSVIRNFYETVQNTAKKSAGLPISFSLRGLKDMAPLKTIIKVDVIRK